MEDKRSKSQSSKRLSKIRRYCSSSRLIGAEPEGEGVTIVRSSHLFHMLSLGHSGAS